MSSNWDDPAEMLARAQTARAAGDRDVAYQMYARASELSPQDTRAWQGRVDTATSSDEALVSYAYASALEPDDEPLTRTLDASISQRIQTATKSDVPLLVALGQELAEVGLTERAHQVLTQASELDPSSTDALVWLAGTSSNDQQQLDYLERALATNPRDPRARAGFLTVKLPAPPPAATGASEAVVAASAGAAAATTPVMQTAAVTSAPPPAPAPAPSAATESNTMERLRKQSAESPPAEKTAPVPPVEQFDSPAPSGRNPLQLILIGLLVLVAVLVIAGIILMQSQ